jgi:hypothetical protein
MLVCALENVMQYPKTSKYMSMILNMFKQYPDASKSWSVFLQILMQYYAERQKNADIVLVNVH